MLAHGPTWMVRQWGDAMKRHRDWAEIHFCVWRALRKCVKKRSGHRIFSEEKQKCREERRLWMHRRNKIADSLMRCGFEPRTHEPCVPTEALRRFNNERQCFDRLSNRFRDRKEATGSSTAWEHAPKIQPCLRRLTGIGGFRGQCSECARRMNRGIDQRKGSTWCTVLLGLW